MPDKPTQHSQTEAILKGKCPRCRTGDLFPHNPYNPNKILHVNKECPHCHLNIEREPGFLYGAMYISYAVNVAIMITFGFAVQIFLGDQEVWVYLTAIFGGVFLLFPLNYRYSRILYIYLFGGFEFFPEYVDNPPEQDV